MNNSKFKKGVKGSKKSLTGFQKQVQSMKGMIAGAFATAAVANFAKSSFQALDTQRKAEAALLTSLKGRSDVQQRLISQAQALQKITLYGDEETIRAQALLGTMIQEEETIRKLIPLIQDFATAKGMQLSAAADLVAKSMGSSTNALSRYGIEVTGAVGSSERLETMTRGLSNAFLGQAKAAAEADTSLTQLKNKWGDFKEFMAGTLLEMKPVVDGTIKAIRSKDISNWEKFLGLFSAQKALELQLMAEAMEDMDMHVGGVGGFLQSAEGGGGVSLPSVASVSPMGSDAVLPDFINSMTWLKGGDMEEAINNVRRGREEMEYFKGVLGDTSETIYASAGPAVDMMGVNFNGLEDALSGVNKKGIDIGQTVGMMLVNQFDSLGEAIGSFASGAEGAFNSLGDAIMQNLGNILIMMGAQMGPAGLPFILAGAGLQLGGGLLRGLGKKAPAMAGSSPGGSVDFRIQGKDLVGTLDRQNYSNHMNT